jgi:WD40 repeat protein
LRAAIPPGPGEVRGFDLSADGDRVAISYGGSLQVWEATAEKLAPRASWTKNLPLERCTWSPDGKTLAVGSSTGPVYLLRPDGETMQERATLAEPKSVISRLSFSSDSKTLAAACTDSNAHVWDLAGPQPFHRAAIKSDNSLMSVSLHPDGKSLAVGGYVAGVKLHDLTDNPPRERQSLESSGTFSVAYRPDGRALASSSLHGQVIVWDPDTGKKLQSWQFPGSVEQVGWADNRHLVTLNANKTIYVLRLAPPAKQ